MVRKSASQSKKNNHSFQEQKVTFTLFIFLRLLIQKHEKPKEIQSNTKLKIFCFQEKNLIPSSAIVSIYEHI